MSWLNNLFAGSEAPAQLATQPVQPNPSQEPTPQVTQSVQQPTQQAQNPQNALDMLMALGQNNASSQTPQAPSLTIPQETLDKVAASIDYSRAIPQEALQKLQAGDMSALGEILNSALQAQYKTIMQHSTQLTDKFVSDRSAYDVGTTKQTIRGDLVESSLDLKDMHPLAQNMFRGIAKDLAKQYPDATPKDIETRAWEAMETLGNQFNRTAKKEAATQKASEINWDTWGGFNS